MNNDSPGGGWLIPVASTQQDDEALERTLSRWVRGVSGLKPGHIRPRWTPEQPPLMPADTDWCAFGITGFQADDNPALISTDDEGSVLWRHEVVECMASFYGPGSQRSVTLFRDGLTLSQNNDALNAAGLSFAGAGNIIPFPERISHQWVRRYDITVTLRRKVMREYRVKSLREAPVTFSGE